MRMYDTDRVQLFAGVVCSLDLTAAVAVVNVDGTDYPTTWVTSPVVDGANWKRTARTNAWFAGPAVTPNGTDIHLTVGSHDTELDVTAEGAKLTYKLPSISVRT